MKKSEERLIKKVEKEIKKMLKGDPFDLQDNMDLLAEDLEERNQYRIKDYNFGINYFMNKELNVYKTKKGSEGVEEDARFYEICKKVLELSIKYRRENNKKISKVETNILTHAPYFVGGSRKRKAKGREEGYIRIDKGGIRKLTYENDLGIMLTMADAKTLFALFSVWEDQGFSEWVNFTEYKLLSKMNLKDGGKQYKGLRESLEKLRNTSIVMREAYDIETGTREVTERFKLIIADKFTEDINVKGETQSRQYEIQFSPYINTSLNKGYYSLISLTIFNDIEIETAQGIYLMFIGINNMENKGKYTKGNRFEIPLEEVYETLFIESDRYKRKGLIEKGCDELKDVGVIEEYYFKYEGKKNESLVLVPTEWQSKLIKKRDELGDIESNLLER